jgi:Domain of unknown function (DUF6458)
MRIGAALVLIAVGAILRFALTTVITHGVALHTVGDILMGVGVLGLIIWFCVWGPWTRTRDTSRTTRTTTRPDGTQYTQYERQSGTYPPDERRYEDEYPR